MSIKNYNTYFKEEDGKIYYYDENGEKKYVPSTAFSNLQEQIDSIGKPLTYSGSKSVTEINTLEEIKIGTVYTITGEAGNITAGNVDVKQGDEIAWGGEPAQWFNIGKDKVDSWKTWSEEHGSTGTNDGVYLGKNNTANKEAYVIGYKNSADLGAAIIGRENSASRGALVIGNESIGDTGATVIGKSSYGKLGFKSIGEANKGSQGGGAFGNSNIAGKGGYIVGDNNLSYRWDSNTSSYKTFVIQKNTNGENYATQYVFGYNNSINDGYGPILNGVTPLQIGCYNIIQDHIKYNDVDYYHSNSCSPFGNINLGRNNSAVNHGINIGTSNLILTGDGSVAASINIGKYLDNRYGVLIGQNISSYGYGIGLGSYIPYVMNGDSIVGFSINANTNGLGQTGSYNARNIFGSNINGIYTYDANVFGSYISAYSGVIPNRMTPYTETCYGIGYGSIVIGTHIKGGVLYGSMLIAQNGQDADKDLSNNIIPLVAQYDSTIIGGYSNNNYDQIAYYKNPGISAYCNGLILGQGQQMTASYNSIIVGQQSIAMDGSKVFGSHGYARGASLVMNQATMTYAPKSITISHINGMAVTSAPEIYGSYTAEGILKMVNGSLSAEKIKLSGDRIHPFNKNYIYYWAIFHKTNLTNENSSFAAFNLRGDGWIRRENGYWNNDKTIFTKDASYGQNAIILNWTRGAYLLRIENGVKKLYEYNEQTSSTVDFPLYAVYVDEGYPTYNSNSFYASPGTSVYDRFYSPNSLKSHNILTDGKFIYHMPHSEFGGGFRVWNSVTSYIPTSFSGSDGYEGSSTYYYSDGKIYTSPIDVTAYGLNGVTGQISQRTSSVYPSAIYDVSSMVANSTAEWGSISIGQKNSSYNGSVAINTEPSGSNDGWTAQHSIAYNQNTYEDKNYYAFNEDSTTISLTSDTKTLPTYRSAGFVMSADAENIAGCASVSIGVGTKGGWTNSAWEQSLVIGSKSTATYNSFAIGRGASAYEHAFALGHSNGCTAYNYSYSLGGNGCNSEYYSYALGHDGITSRNHSYVFGNHGVYAENKSFAIGTDGISARNQGIAIGAFGTYANNWGLSIGAKGRATNQSINLSMGSYEGSYTTAENGSINILAATHNSPAGAFTKSISIRASEGGATTAQNGSINIISNSTGRTNTTADNQSMILATKYYHPQVAYISAYNNSMLIGAGILNTTASNDSISIGGGKIIDNDSYSQQIYNGSVAIGYGNTANGGVFVQGSRNLLGTTYTSFDNRPIDYTQSIVFGDSNTACNYRPYLWANKTAYSGDKYISAYISTDRKKTPHGNGSATYTKNMIVGNFNYVVGYNSFTFGLNNTAGCLEYNYNQSTDMISGDKNDDGFTFVFGLNNYARRNYDMAIGFGTYASGGENIAIGTLINGNRGTEAIGYKNISIRSVLSGIGNIGIEAVPSITAAGSYNNLFKNVTASNINVHQDVADNILYNVVNNSFISTGTYGELNRNIFNSLSRTNLNADGGIDRNIIRYTDSDNFGFSSNFTDNIINYSRESQLGGGEMHKNILWNTDNLYVSASQINNNILLDIGNKNSYDKTNISLYQLQDNIIRKSSLINSLTSNGGVIDKNFLLNSVVSLSGNNQGKGIDDGHWNTDAYVTNSFIVGTVTMGSVGESFSFGGMGLDYNVSNTDGVYRFGNNTRYNPILQHVQQTFNFGDNTIVNTQSVITEGCGNEIYGAENSRILGETNGIVSNCCNPTWSGWNGNGNNIMEATVIGTCNFMGQYSAGSAFTNNTLIGQSNDITLNNIIPDTYPSVTNNTLIGSYNAQLEVYENLISFAIENGIYNYFNSAGHDSKYNILNAPGNSAGINFGQQMSGYGLTGQSNRNVILGNHSVIGSNINDSTLIGNSNTIAALANSRRLEILQIYSANAEPWESGKQTYVNNCCSYENDLYWRKYNWNLTAAPTASNSWWVKIEGSNDITTSMFEPTISNNFGAGSYNLLLAGSNQVNIGSENITSGHNATAIGEGLRAKTSQFVIGRFNEELDGTNGLSADNIDSTSGTLFIVGNGKHKISDYRTSAVERSNAMIVSANGLVSASNLATSGFADIDATLSTLTNFGTWEIVAGTTTADITTPNSKTIYLIKNTTVAGSDQYEEWICTNTATPAYEKIGDTSIDLSQYVPLTSYQALENRVAQLETLLTTYSARWVLTQV